VCVSLNNALQSDRWTLQSDRDDIAFRVTEKEDSLTEGRSYTCVRMSMCTYVSIYVYAYVCARGAE
jgi:hypothetical protein